MIDALRRWFARTDVRLQPTAISDSAASKAAPFQEWRRMGLPSEDSFGGPTGVATDGRRSLVALRRRLSPGLPLSRFPHGEGKRSCR